METKLWFLVNYQDDNRKAEIIHVEPKSIWVNGWQNIYSSISPGYDTEEELRERQKILDEPCKCCGSPFGTTYHEPIDSKLRELNICFSCNFWYDKMKMKNRIIINGTMYGDGGNGKTDAIGFKGHGGREFKIEFLEDGRILETNNLWCNGDIPQIFRDKFPDNAKFLPTEKDKRIQSLKNSDFDNSTNLNLN